MDNVCNKCKRIATMSLEPGVWLCTYHGNIRKKEIRIQRKLNQKKTAQPNSH